MRVLNLSVATVLLAILSLATIVFGAPATSPPKTPSGDFDFKVGAQYTAGQIVAYESNRYRVLLNHVSQVDWYPGCCATIWEPISSAGSGKVLARQVGTGAPVSGGTVGEAVNTAPPGGVWADKTYAPYVDILLWPTLDISVVAAATNVKHYTLAFIFADGNKNAAWGGVTPASSGFYLDIVTKLRNMGGDVIVSFGGAIGQELAIVETDVKALTAKYQAVINQYQITWADFDIEGPALLDKASVDRRNQALVALQKANPQLRIGYTLPVLPTGLTADGVNLLQSAAKAGLRVDVVNIMAMDYGPGVAPNGATGMGGYGISAAAATYAQAQGAKLTAAKIGVCPMIGQNDVAGEIFRLEDAKQLLDWANSVNYVAEISMWSINRDTSKSGPLYASSQLKQADYDFAKIFIAYETGATVTVPSGGGKPTTVAPPVPIPSSVPLQPGNWGPRVFAPYVDVLLWPTLDIAAVAQRTGNLLYTLAFITADSAKNPAWGGITKWSDNFYLDILTRLRALGGDAIISFGGATGQELALPVTDVAQLQAKYQAVIDTYKATWVDFDIEGAAISNTASVERRNKAIAGLQKANPKLIVGYTLPVMPTGLDKNAVKLLESAVKNGVRVDVINIMAMDYGPSAAPNGATGMGGYAISAAQATYQQAQSVGLTTTKIGICPMIGQNDVAGEIFRQEDAQQLLAWAQKTAWVAEIAMWSVSRDTSTKGPLYASSQITQKDYEFMSIFKAANVAPTKATTTTTTTTKAATPTPVKPNFQFPLPVPGKLTRVMARDAQPTNAPDNRDKTIFQVPLPERPKNPEDLPQPDESLIIQPSTDEPSVEKRGLAAGVARLGLSQTWTTRTFSPYIDVTAWPTFDMVQAAAKSGLRHFTLGFVVADKQGDPSWGGYYKTKDGFYADQIEKVRKDYHGEIIVSFGGAAGKELALKAKSVDALVATYQSVIDKYKITWADFDIEGKTLMNKKVVDLRNQALAKLKKQNPGLVISYTLPVETTGLTSEALYLLKNALNNGLTVDLVNVMAMDWDPKDCPGTKCATAMGDHAISAATNTIANLVALGYPADVKIGLTPMIGVNDIASEIFTLQNAQDIINHAVKNQNLAFIGFWSLNRDNGAQGVDSEQCSGVVQGDWAFSNLLAVFAH
ncbi:glycoside hydrolase superfamily [Phlyctochytrium arcticum]|nr:glycoside hydrolase superfamily [Phlyctochytrium arcticum]